MSMYSHLEIIIQAQWDDFLENIEIRDYLPKHNFDEILELSRCTHNRVY